MNMMRAGLALVMILLMMGRDMRAMWPTEPLFWFVMSLGVVVGFLVAYPVNVWLVAKAMKHGLMTVERKRRRGHSAAAHAANPDHGAHEAMSHESASHSSREDGSYQKHASHSPKHAIVTRPQLVAL